MSTTEKQDDDKIKLEDSYDLTKNIENLIINTGFIVGLETILIRYFTEIVEDKSKLPATFKKFEDFIKGEIKQEELQLDQIEYEIYTLYALQQAMKAKAYEQDLVIKNERTVHKSDLKELTQAYLEKDIEKIKELSKKLQLS